MSVFELTEITPRALFNKIKGHERAVREQWERTRLQCYYSFSPLDPKDPERKMLQPITEFMPFTWEEGTANKSSFDKLKEEALKAREQAKRDWVYIDKTKN